MEQTPDIEIQETVSNKEIAEFSKWIKENGAGGCDKHGRPNVLLIPKSAGWSKWVSEYQSTTKVEQGMLSCKIIEPHVSWSPLDGLSKTIIGESGKGWYMVNLKNLMPSKMHDFFFPYRQEMFANDLVDLHLHPIFLRANVWRANVWYSPGDLFTLVSSQNLRMIVAADSRHLYTMAFKGPEIEKGYNDHLLRKVKKTMFPSLGRNSQPEAYCIKIGNQLFGSNTPYDLAFYVGAEVETEGDILFKRIDIKVVENNKDQIVHLKWTPLDEKDSKLKQPEFAKHVNLSLRKFLKQ